MRAKSRASSQFPRGSGYTLLEVVIGMTLTAMLMVALVTGLGVASKAWQRGEARLRETERNEERSSFVAGQITSLIPYQVQSQDPDLAGLWTIIEARPMRLRFVSTEGTYFLGRSGLVLVEYALVPSTPPGSVALALHETPVQDDAILLHSLIERVGSDPDTGKRVIFYRPSAIQPDDLRLLTGLEAARFEYLNPHPKPDAPMWVSDWEGTVETPYPAAIRLRWQQAGHPGELVFPLRAQGLPQGLQP